MDSLHALRISPQPALIENPGFWKTRGPQAFHLLLASVPIAERMLLYHLAMAALSWLPDQGILEFLRPPSV